MLVASQNQSSDMISPEHQQTSTTATSSDDSKAQPTPQPTTPIFKAFMPPTMPFNPQMVMGMMAQAHAQASAAMSASSGTNGSAPSPWKPPPALPGMFGLFGGAFPPRPRMPSMSSPNSTDVRFSKNHVGVSRPTIHKEKKSKSSTSTRERRTEWTAADDTRLAELVARYGHKWSSIAVAFGTRTRAQCRKRWAKLIAEGKGPQFPECDEEEEAAMNILRSFKGGDKAMLHRSRSTTTSENDGNAHFQSQSLSDGGSEAGSIAADDGAVSSAVDGAVSSAVDGAVSSAVDGAVSSAVDGAVSSAVVVAELGDGQVKENTAASVQEMTTTKSKEQEPAQVAACNESVVEGETVDSSQEEYRTSNKVEDFEGTSSHVDAASNVDSKKQAKIVVSDKLAAATVEGMPTQTDGDRATVEKPTADEDDYKLEPEVAVATDADSTVTASADGKYDDVDQAMREPTPEPTQSQSMPISELLPRFSPMIAKWSARTQTPTPPHTPPENTHTARSVSAS